VLAPAFLQLPVEALDFFRGRYGPSGTGSLGIFESICRESSSDNWAAQGLITFDTGALNNDELAAEKLAHEVAQLWWGQLVNAQGDGERFLTEGLAEASCWRFVTHQSGAAVGRELVES
jgi:hypothetical protein